MQFEIEFVSVLLLGLEFVVLSEVDVWLEVAQLPHELDHELESLYELPQLVEAVELPHSSES